MRGTSASLWHEKEVCHGLPLGAITSIGTATNGMSLGAEF